MDHLKHNLNDIVRIARLAPSAHNAQPWAIELDSEVLSVTVPSGRALGAGDPTGRQTIIGLGVFTESVIIAAAAYGLDLDKLSFIATPPKVSLRFRPMESPSETKKLVELLRGRCTDRSLYSPIEVTPAISASVARAWDDSSAKIIVSKEPKIIEKVADLNARGMQLALSSPAFREELSEYLIPPLSSRRTGIPVKSMRVSPFLYFLQPSMIRHNLGLGMSITQERRRWQSASGLVFVTTKGDMPPNWLAAGRAYLRTSLAIEELGLSQATSAAIVEASDFHEDIEKLLDTSMRIQCILRIGKGSSHKVFSPRLDERELIIT